MEENEKQLNIFEKRLLEEDKLGNRWRIENNIVYLKLKSEGFERKLGLIVNDRFVVYREREKHRFNKTNSYGFSAEVIDALYKLKRIQFVDLYDEFGMYRLSIDTIRNGEYLFFKEEGFEKQLFVPIPIIEQSKLELPEDINRKSLLGESWFNQLRAEFHKPYWDALGREVAKRRITTTVYPDKEDVFKAFKLTPYEDVRVVIIGQDPYHNGVADGLAFSSKDELRTPPSLEKIYEAIEEDIKFGMYLDQNPSLEYLAKQGVLLLNTALTVEEGNPASHVNLGWGLFIERVLEVLKHHNRDLVFLLWGSYAKGLRPRVEDMRHMIVEAEHPVMGAREARRWNNNDCFKKTNSFLHLKGYGEINW